MIEDNFDLRTLAGDTMVFAILFGLANVASYLFVVIAGRMLPPTQFGVFNALVGILGMAGIFISSLQAAITQSVVVVAGRATLVRMLRTIWRLGLVTTALGVLIASPFASSIGANIPDVVICGCTILLMLLAVVPLGHMGALGKLRSQAAVSLVGTVARLATGCALILAGLGTSGALVGYAVQYLVILGVGAFLVANGAAGSSARRQIACPELKLDKPAIATFVVAFTPFCLDQLLVQSINPLLGGDYAAMSTTAKLVFFATLPIISVAYPYLLKSVSLRRRIRILAAAGIALAIVATFTTVAIGLFPDKIIQLFFENRYPNAQTHIVTMALGVALFSLSALAIHAQIALDGRLGSLPSIAAILIGVGLYMLNHATIEDVVNNQVATYALQLVFVLGFLALTIARRRRQWHLAAASKSVA